MLITFYNFTVNINIYQDAHLSSIEVCEYHSKNDKRFFKIPEPKNAAERKRAQQWIHNMSMGQDIKRF